MVILSKNTRGYVKKMLGSLRKKKSICQTNQIYQSGTLTCKSHPDIDLQMNQSFNIFPVLEYTFVEDCK